MPTAERNARGDWVPVPFPLFMAFRKQCGSCGRLFWTMGGYRRHYADDHSR